MEIDTEIIVALKQSRLAVAKMRARQQLLQNQIEDIKTDTELLLGPFSAQAEQIVEAGEKAHKNHQKVIETIQSWHGDIQRVVDSMLEDKEPAAEAYDEVHEAVSKFMVRSAKYESSSLNEMTEIVRLITQANADLRRAVAGDSEYGL